MERARLVQLPAPQRVRNARQRGLGRPRHRAPDPRGSRACRVRRERPEDERAAIVERALRIGLLALQDAGVAVNVDVVRREFETLLSRTEAANEKAAAALDVVLRQNFADGDGRLPRTLERFLGDRGQLRSFVNELFDQTKRDSAIGRMKLLLGNYSMGCLAARATAGSHAHGFAPPPVPRGGQRGLHQAQRTADRDGGGRNARANGAAESAAKGADFESTVSDCSVMSCAARGTSSIAPARSRGRRAIEEGRPAAHAGRRHTRGAELRVVVECKDRPCPGGRCGMSSRMPSEIGRLRGSRRLHAAARAGGIAPLTSATETSTASSILRIHNPPRWKPRSGWPGCWRSQRCVSTRPASTPQRSDRRSPRSAPSWRRSAG